MATPIKLIIKGLRNLAKPKYKRPSDRFLGYGRERENNILTLALLGGTTAATGGSIAGIAMRPEGKPWGQKLAAINRKKKKRRDARKRVSSQGNPHRGEGKYGYGSK